ncbi:MAG: DNA translocase FtsK 4TM domain-containing protein [Rikenellaceae bacterium]
MAKRTKNIDKNVEDNYVITNRDTLRWMLGLALFCVGVFSVVSVLFYYVDWKADYSLLNGVNSDSPKFDMSQIANPCGRIGAWIGEILIGRSFGLVGIVIPIVLTMLGVRVLKREPLRLNRTLIGASLILIFGSLTFGFIFSGFETFNSGPGGGFGVELSKLLMGVVGGVGVVIILLCAWIGIGVFINRNFINTVNNAGQAAVGGGEKIVDIMKNSVKSRPQDTLDPQLVDDEPRSEPIVNDEPPVQPIVEEPNPFFVAPPEPTEPVVAAEVAAAEPIQEPEECAVPPTVILPSPPTKRVVADVEPKEEPSPFTVLDDGEEIMGEETINSAYSRMRREGLELVDVDDSGAVIEPTSEPTFETTPAVEPTSRHKEGIELLGGEEEVELSIDQPSPDIVEEDEESGIVITVEANEEELLDEDDSNSVLYDPLRDLYNYERPPASLLEDYRSEFEVNDDEIYDNKSRIEETLKNFGIPISKIKATVGPTITLYEIVQAQGVKIAKIQGLENDIAQSLKALGIRIIAPIPGRGTIGIEVPNRNKQVVSMYSAVQSAKFREMKAELPIVIGRTIQNSSYAFDLAKMPHLLVAGATGQGKSVGLNAIITSLLYRKHPAELKLVMIDPKMVEFTPYKNLERHFMAKMESEDDVIITDPKKAVYTLNALCEEMEKRLKLLSQAAVRNIVEYNDKFKRRALNPENGHFYMPYIVVVVDEFADLIMMTREVEAPVMRLAQKARAVGIHLIIATQRPDVKVITGGIKANFPARIAFRVMQMIDSRTIIDQPGANQLIGRGDMLFSKDGELTRVQCALVETDEVQRIVDHISRQQGYSEAYRLPDYSPEGGGDADMGSQSGAPIKYDSLFAEIARTAVSGGALSTSYIQRNFEVGFNRAGRIMTQLEKAGIVGRQEGAKPREILFHDSQSLEAKLQDLGVS